MKRIIALILILLLAFSTTGCLDEADIVSQNLSKEADNFNVIRQVTGINAITGDVVFQMTGRLSIESVVGSRVDVIVEYAPEKYAKHFLFVGDNGMIVVEQLEPSDIDPYNYTLNYNPNMWLPFKVDTVD